MVKITSTTFDEDGTETRTVRDYPGMALVVGHSPGEPLRLVPEDGGDFPCCAPKLPRLNVGGEDYTDAPTRYRILKEDHGDDWPWVLDGVDDARNYTEDVRRFATWQDAVDALPEFAEQNPLAWFGACGVAHCAECVPRFDHRNRELPEESTA